MSTPSRKIAPDAPKLTRRDGWLGLVPVKVGVFGAGAIGCFVGVRLSAVGFDVTLVGRKKLIEQGSDLSARTIEGDLLRPQTLRVVEDAGSLADVDVVLVTMKSTDTPAAVSTLSNIVKKDALVVSLQNGVRNVALLRAIDADVVPGMVTFNVIWEGGKLEQATSGPILIGTASRRMDLLDQLVAGLRDAKLRAGIRKDMDAIQMGKLLLNLNNGIAAATGLPVAQLIRSRPIRRAYAICIREGLAVAKQAKKSVASIGVLDPWLISHMLLLPDPIFFRVAKRMISIDPRARSSTLQDLDRKRKTEIDHLNGEIVRMAEQIGARAPANAFITDTIHRIEEGARSLTPEEVLAGVS